MKFFKSSRIAFVLGFCLLISLYFNFKPQTPLISFEVHYPFEDGGGSEIKYTYDSNKNPDDVLYTESILLQLNSVDSNKVFDYDEPDIILWRCIPSWGVAQGIYNLYFEGDGTYVLLGNTPEDSIVYYLEESDTDMLKECTQFLPNYTPTINN